LFLIERPVRRTHPGNAMASRGRQLRILRSIAAE
jgi:hypothetical protein